MSSTRPASLRDGASPKRMSSIQERAAQFESENSPPPTGVVRSRSKTASSANVVPSLEMRRLSISTMQEQSVDLQINDDLAVQQKKLKELKGKISTQSKRNFLLERDVRYLDSRIALLIQNRKSLDDDALLQQDENITTDNVMEEKKKQLYGNFFFLLQTEPRLVSHLVRLLSLSQIDTLLQTVMFTLYGNQYDSREEHLLLTMFSTVLQFDIETATDFGSLLRANTPVSRMMTTYTRRGPGQQYLKSILSENLADIIKDDDLNLEIDPLKVYAQYLNDMEVETGVTSELPRTVTLQEAQSNQKIMDIVNPRVEKLSSIAQKLLQTIFSSMNSVPYGIRWICKQIQLLVKKKFPEASDASITSLIGGFFFLRFINPAIVTPESYMIVDAKPTTLPRRSLTLIAKMIQNLANKPTYSKEAYMQETNDFITSNKENIVQFLSSLCQVEDFYETLELDQYMTISKKDISINVSLNEIYNTHDLFKQHLQTICPASAARPRSASSKAAASQVSPEQSYQLSCSHLKSLMTDLGDVPPQLARKDNKNINLNLFSRWEAAPILFPHMVDVLSATQKIVRRTSRASLTEADMLYLDTKQSIVGILRKQAENYVNKIDAFNPELRIDNVDGVLDVEKFLDYTLGSKDQTIKRKSMRTVQSLRMLEDRHKHPNVSHLDGHVLLVQDVKKEFVELQSNSQRIVQDLASLEGVYKTICDHNQYMRSQLESYKAYLQNVRIQAGGGSKGVKPSLPQKQQPLHSKASTTVVKYTHSQLEKEGVISRSTVPVNRKGEVYFTISSPLPGSFLVSLLYKGRSKPIVQVDLKLDDLLEKQQDNVQYLDLEYVQLNVNKMLHVLNKHFLKR